MPLSLLAIRPPVCLSACLCSRLWGSHGQMNLETAHICCIGSGATASETLKNLVLPSTCKRIDARLSASASSCSQTLRLFSLPPFAYLRLLVDLIAVCVLQTLVASL